MADVLNKANIQPNKQYSIAELQDGIRSTLNHNPSIHCIREKYTGENYLSEIRICFNRQLELIDCVGVHSKDNSSNEIITNCDSNEPIFYPATVPPHLFNVVHIGKSMEKTIRRYPWIIKLYNVLLSPVRIVASFANWLEAISQDLKEMQRFISAHVGDVDIPTTLDIAQES